MKKVNIGIFEIKLNNDQISVYKNSKLVKVKDVDVNSAETDFDKFVIKFKEAYKKKFGENTETK